MPQTNDPVATGCHGVSAVRQHRDTEDAAQEGVSGLVYSSARLTIDHEYLRDVAWPPESQPRIYVCGPTGFVEEATQALVDAGQRPHDIKTERFGPTGDKR